VVTADQDAYRTVDTTGFDWSLDFNEAFRGREPKPIPVVMVRDAEVPCGIIALPMRITHGRSDFTVQPDPPSLAMVVLGRVDWQRNDPVSVTVGGRVRFSGFIDGLTTDYVGTRFITKVDAVGWLAKAGNIRPSIPPRPVENDAARVGAFMATVLQAYPTAQIRTQGTPTVDLIPQDVDGGHSVLDLVHDICLSTGGLIWQARDGGVVYGTANHRSGEKAEHLIEECDILDGVQWVKNSSTLVNRVRVNWGPRPADNSDRSVHVDEDAASVQQEGPKEATIDSMLNDVTDATLLANLILFRRAKAYWNLPSGIQVQTRNMGTTEYLSFLDIDISDEVALRVARQPMPLAASMVEWVVEGWVEEWNVDTDGLYHVVQMSLSDRQRFGLTGIRTVGELAAGFTVGTAAAMSVRDAMFKEIT
jgi:hypothetical protein